MPRTCTICTHPEREAIDQALVTDTPNRRIAAQFSISEQAVRRHKDEHLPALMVKSEHAREIAHADDLLHEANRLYAVATTVMEAGQKSNNHELVLKAVGTAGRVLGLLGELLGELNRNPVVNLHISAEWIEVRAVLMDALGDFPEARAAVAQALLQVNHGNG